MTWSPDDVTDADVERCERLHTEPNTHCPYCPTRADLRVCAQCQEEIWPHHTCPNCVEATALVVDGFGRALVATPPSSGVGAS